MARDFIHIFGSVFLPIASSDTGAWHPALDIYQARDGWLLKADLAGVRREDILVVVEGQRVTIRGMRRDWCLEEGCCHYRMEIAYSRFERTVELPEDLSRAEVTSEYRDGMLLVRVRRGE
jgi:HSP20 family protein